MNIIAKSEKEDLFFQTRGLRQGRKGRAFPSLPGDNEFDLRHITRRGRRTLTGGVLGVSVKCHDRGSTDENIQPLDALEAACTPYYHTFGGETQSGFGFRDGKFGMYQVRIKAIGNSYDLAFS